MKENQAVPTGVYYQRDDYVGAARRLLIDLIDVPVAVVLSLLLVGAVGAAVPGVAERPGIMLLLCGVLWFTYFVLLKRSTFRTLGYRVVGARVCQHLRRAVARDTCGSWTD